MTKPANPSKSFRAEFAPEINAPILCSVSKTMAGKSLITGISVLLLSACVMHWSYNAQAQQEAKKITITVGPNVQASKSRNDLVHNEVLLAADPNNAKNLLGCTMAFSPQQNKISTMAYASSDNGISWNFAVANDTGIVSADPACTFGQDGRAYFIAIERTGPRADTLVIYRSTDYGKTWSPRTVLLASAPSVDRAYVVVDQTNSKYRGRVYIYGQIAQRTVDGEFAGLSIALWRSLDNGVTFEGPIVRSRDKPLSFHPANSVVLSDGTVVCLVAELDSQKRNDGYAGSQYRKADVQNGTLKVLTSSDGGESLTPAVKISDMYEDWREGSTGLPSLAADAGSTAFKDRLYAVWADGRYGRTQILLSYSTDKGKTWSGPKVVSDGQTTNGDGSDCFMPVVSVNAEGVVGVMWYDKRDIPGGLGYNVRFAASLDGGETWQPSVRVSQSPKTFENRGTLPITGGVWRGGAGVLSLNVRRYEWLAGGHTAGMTADANGIFHPFWVDNRTGLSQIWTAPVVVRGTVAKNGSLDLAQLDDVSSSTMLELSDCNYDNANNVVSCSARLKNTSQDTLPVPLKMRVVTFTSDLGTPRILNADNGEGGAGAVWEFGKEIDSGWLKPGENSHSKLFRFQILNPQEFWQNNQFKSTFVLMDFRVLAQPAATETTRKVIPATPK